MFNWEDIIANSVSSCITATHEGLHWRKSKFYMGSFLIDCILLLHPFENLKCSWKEGKELFYATYHILWAHKYHNFYNLICEEFLMPLYQIIFLEECKCMSEGFRFLTLS